MATFILNEGYDGAREIEAHQFAEAGSFVIFYDGSGDQVLACPTGRVHVITRKPD
ncbi:hypothetical protein BH93_11400 [Rhodococcoides fascians A25f]|uniref:hypothetical protein n=1 Tax=Rhodococcoides fascians TaxID=1828 RepID=UPI000B07AF90|nr:hypothetical protein [Rhodococcus fascians]QII05896.1 hypothetical protein BH93_11400 [Rhodococcus fascians A25f]